jgi:Ca2+-binding EF-hand superfamily protein
MELNMKIKILILAILAALLFYPAFTLASQCGHGMFTSNITDMDKNSDKKITFDEFKDFRIKDLKVAFDTLDENKDGVLDENEWNEFIRVHTVK